MATLNEIIQYSKANPTSDYAKQAQQLITSGGFDEQAAKEGVDLSWAGRPKVALVTNPAPTQDPLTTYAGKVGGDYMGAAKDIIKSGSQLIKPATEPTLGGQIKKDALAALDLVGKPLGAVWAPVSEAIAPILDKLLSNPAPMKNGKDANAALKQISDLAGKHPEAANAIQNLVNIVGSFLVGAKAPEIKGAIKTGAQSLAEGGTAIVNEVKGAITKTPEKIAAKESASAWKLIQPELTTTEQAAARKVPGQITQKGALRTTTLNPVGTDAKMLEAAQPYLQGVKSAGEAIPKLQDAIAQEATKLRAGLDKSEAIWNVNELKGTLNKLEKPHLLSGDLEKSFNKTLKVVLDQSGTANKKLSGLLDIRQQFDQVVAKQYPNIYNSDTMTAIKTAVTNTRRAINDLIASKLPDGITTDGISFKDSLSKQSHLYDAVDNAATNAAKESKIGSNVITRTEAAIKKHPVVTSVGAAASVLGGAKLLGL